MGIIVEFVIDFLLSGLLFAVVNYLFYKLIYFTSIKPIKAMFRPIFNFFKKNKKEKKE